MPRSDKLNVLISGRMDELKSKRLAVEQALKPFCSVILAENTPDPEAPEPKSLRWARECDVYLGLYGSEYGPSELSLTHREFRMARDSGKKLVVLVTGTPFGKQCDFLAEVKDATSWKECPTGDMLCRVAQDELEHICDEWSRRLLQVFSWLAVRASITLALLLNGIGCCKEAIITWKRLYRDDKPWLMAYALEQVANIYYVEKRYLQAEQTKEEYLRLVEALSHKVPAENIDPQEIWLVEALGYQTYDKDWLSTDENLAHNLDWTLDHDYQSWMLEETRAQLASLYLAHAGKLANEDKPEDVLTLLQPDRVFKMIERAGIKSDALQLVVQAHCAQVQSYATRGVYDDALQASQEALENMRKLGTRDLWGKVVDTCLDLADQCFSSRAVAYGKASLALAEQVAREARSKELQYLVSTRILKHWYDLGLESLLTGRQQIETRLGFLSENLTTSESNREREMGQFLDLVTRNAESSIKEARSEWGV